MDSPSRQLLWELNQLAISSQEGFYAHLDRENEEREDLHKQALAKAARKHERVRENAEIEKQRLEEEQEAKQKRQEEEQRRALEMQRRENELAEQRREAERARAAEQHRRELAEVHRFRNEVEERHRVERQRLDAESAKKLKEQRDAEKERQTDTKAVEAKAKEIAIAAVKPKAEPTPARVTQPVIKSEWELEHDRYIEIHQRLKDLRKFMIKAAKERPELKSEMGNMRRDIKKSVGQLNKTKGGNTKPLKSIIDILKKALTLPEPKVNITNFLAHAPPTPPANPDGPALLVYLLNTFSKDIIAQFIDEAGVYPTAADSVGVIASHIFALGFFRWEGISLVDILLAKMHVVAPAIFGIYGPENTIQGKERLGWWRLESRSEGPFVDQQQHFIRMTGLGAGFAALSLRNYEKAKAVNPFPESHYWEALATIASVPAAAIPQTHFVLLKALIENYETKFIGFYGGAAVAALREVLIELPARCLPSVASKSLAGLRDVLAREKKLFL